MAESPARLLMGKSPKSYSRRDLEEILQFYGQPCTYGSLSKAELIQQVRSLAKDFGLGSVDRNEALHYRTRYRRLEKQRRKHLAILSRIQRQIEAGRSGSPEPALPLEPTLSNSAQRASSPRVVIILDDSDPLETSQSLVSCSICMETIIPGQRLPRNPTDQCSHDRTICRPCFSAYITNRIDEYGVQQLVCPLDCSRQLTRQEILDFATPADISRYDDLLSMNTIHNDPDYRECAYPDCRIGQIFQPDDDEDLRMECPYCERYTCINCSSPDHRQQACEEAQINRQQAVREGSQSSEEHLRGDDTACCPGCGSWISRTGGCNHMTCRCGHEFCFLCLTSWQGRFCGYYRCGNIQHNQSSA